MKCLKFEFRAQRKSATAATQVCLPVCGQQKAPGLAEKGSCFRRILPFLASILCGNPGIENKVALAKKSSFCFKISKKEDVCLHFFKATFKTKAMSAAWPCQSPRGKPGWPPTSNLTSEARLSPSK